MPLDPRQAYLNGFLQDVRYHNSTDAYSDCDIFPDTVKEYITLLHDAFQLPTWVKEAHVDFRLGTRRGEWERGRERAKLADCYKRVGARHRGVGSARSTPQAPKSNSPSPPNPAWLRRIWLNTSPRKTFKRPRSLVCRLGLTMKPGPVAKSAAQSRALGPSRALKNTIESVMVALPRHWSGESSPLFGYMETTVEAALLVSVSAEVPPTSPALAGDMDDLGGDNCDGDENNSRTSADNGKGSANKGTRLAGSNGIKQTQVEVCMEPGKRPVFLFPDLPMYTASEWLDLPSNREIDEDEYTDEDEDAVEYQCSLNLHILDYVPFRRLPTDACMPILCMGDESTLPIIMTSALYQRHVWHVDEPVIGVSFLQILLSATKNTSCLGSAKSELGESETVGAELQPPPTSFIWMSEDGHKVPRFWVRGAPEQCSKFCAKAGVSTDDHALVWLFDRKAALVSVTSDSEMFKIYEDVTKFIWPKAWNTLNDLPLVDDTVHPIRDRLWALVNIRKKRGYHWLDETSSKRPNEDNGTESDGTKSNNEYGNNDIDRNVDKIDVDDARWQQVFELLTGSLSTIAHTCMHAEAKVRLGEVPIEATCRHDLHRVCVDFLVDGVWDSIASREPTSPESVHVRPSYVIVTALQILADWEIRLERTIALPRNYFSDVLVRSGNKKEAYTFTYDIEDKFRAELQLLKEWGGRRMRAERLAQVEKDARLEFTTAVNKWYKTITMKRLQISMQSAPLRGICDAIGTVRVTLPLANYILDPYRFVSRIGPPASIEKPAADAQRPGKSHDFGTRPSSSSQEAKPQGLKGQLSPSLKAGQSESAGRATSIQQTRSSATGSSTRGSPSNHGMLYQFSRCESDELSPPKPRARPDRQSTMLEMVMELMENAAIDDVSPAASKPTPSSIEKALELPLLLIEYKKTETDRVKGQNQHRLYCTAAARFLETIGITKVPIFSVVSDGASVVLTTAWVNDGVVQIFERHTQSFDISSPIGAWHYASVLARIAVIWGPQLAERFSAVREGYIKGDSQVTRLDTKKGKTKQKDEENETQQKTAESVQPAGA
ncbi:predicted protein [Postia placenta Mad-698-R]|nr:predicted protein [Postia placenta Mad-698-R]